VPFVHSNPKFGFSAAVAFKQMAVAGTRFCGKTWTLVSAKFWQEVFVLHSMMMASVWFRFGRPTLYQHG